eukprot:12735458-Ditylum_brightwellii.AAC.1
MLLEQVLMLLRGAVGVQKFLREEVIMLKDVSSEAGSMDTSKLEGNEEVEAATTISSSDVPPHSTLSYFCIEFHQYQACGSIMTTHGFGKIVAELLFWSSLQPSYAM